MTDDELRDFAMDFREGILGGRSPEGMCFAVAAPLAGLLECSGVKAELVESDLSDHPETVWYEHVWIKLADGRVLDPTFDQFCSEEPVPVYIGKPTEFHQSPVRHGPGKAPGMGDGEGSPYAMRPNKITDKQIADAYQKFRSIHAVSRYLNISFTSLQRRLKRIEKDKEVGLIINPQGYNKVVHEISSRQCRDAREFLGLTRDDFCVKAEISKTTLREFELGIRIPRKTTMDKILGVFRSAGVQFAKDGFRRGRGTKG